MTAAWSNQGTTGVRVFDTGTGQEVVVQDDLREVASPYWTYALTDMYTTTWGVTPPVAGVDPEDLQPSTRTVPYARMDVSISASTVLAGQPVTVELRYLDPVTGEPIVEVNNDVRYDEPDHVRALVTDRNTNEPVQTIVLARSATGVYRGAAVLPGVGIWSLQVVAETADEPSRYVTLRDAVVVQPTLMGDDGRRYMLAVEVADPPARIEQDALVRVAVVDAETGSPLPDDVQLVDGMPDEMVGSATLEARAVTSATLAAISHGMYEGHCTFFAAGRWQIAVNFPQDGIRSGGVPVGVVVVE